MTAANYLRILGVALLLAGYSAWTLTGRDAKPAVSDFDKEVEYPAGVRLLRVAQAEALWHEPGTLFLDVRSLTDYEFGHIAGALSFPEPEFEQHFPALQDRLRQA